MIVLVIVIVAATLATRTHPSTSSTSTSLATYEYTCCSSELVDTIYHPGGVIVVHWVREAASAPRQRMVISSILVGPFDSVTSLKRDVAADSYGTLHPWQRAAALEVLNTGTRSPTSYIHLPSDAKPGFYDLQTETLWKTSGNSIAAGSVIRVTK